MYVDPEDAPKIRLTLVVITAMTLLISWKSIVAAYLWWNLLCISAIYFLFTGRSFL